MTQFKFSDLYCKVQDALKATRAPLLYAANTPEASIESGRREVLAEDELEEGQLAEDELEEILRQRAVAKQLLDEYLPKIEEQLESVTQIQKAYCNWSEKIIEYKCSMLENAKNAEHKDDEVQATLKALYAQQKDLQREVEECAKQKSKEIEKVNHKKNELNKWCWVPFYNIALAVDYDNAVDRCNKRLGELRRKLENLHGEINKKTKEISDKTYISGNTKKLLEICSENNKIITNRINTLNDLLAQWNDIYAFFLRLKSELQSVDDVQEVLKVAAKRLKSLQEEEKHIDYDMVQMPVFFCSTYRIKTFDEKHELFCAEDRKMYLRYWGASLDKNGIFEIFTLANSRCIILNDKRELLQGSEFVPLKEVNPSDNLGHWIKQINNYTRIYEISCTETLSSGQQKVFCLDVKGGKFQDGTVIQLYKTNKTNAQKFFLQLCLI